MILSMKEEADPSRNVSTFDGSKIIAQREYVIRVQISLF